MQKTVSIQRAGKNDFDKVIALLSAEHLPVSDLHPLLEHFFIAMAGSEVAGVMGMDRYGNAGLLRSAVVKASHRNTGIAGALVQQVLKEAAETGISALYLITNTAENYFEKKGFNKITRDEVPATVLQLKEFNGLCPSSSVIMKYDLK